MNISIAQILQALMANQSNQSNIANTQQVGNQNPQQMGFLSGLSNGVKASGIGSLGGK